MDDRDFFDHLYQLWSRTTGAQDTYWMPEEVAELHDGYSIRSVRQDGTQETVANNLVEADADFVTAVHGCVSDLIRRLGDAIDEADRLDEDRDGLVIRIAGLEMQADSYRDEIEDLREQLDRKDERISQEKALTAEANKYFAELDKAAERKQSLIDDLERGWAEVKAENKDLSLEISKLKDLLEHERANVEYWRSR